jgi:hypothetical protein
VDPELRRTLEMYEDLLLKGFLLLFFEQSITQKGLQVCARQRKGDCISEVTGESQAQYDDV